MNYTNIKDYIDGLENLKKIEITIEDDEAIEYGKLIGTEEGFLVGISSGGALAASVEVAKRPESEGKTIVVLLPDSGDRYYSTKLFR